MRGFITVPSKSRDEALPHEYVLVMSCPQEGDIIGFSGEYSWLSNTYRSRVRTQGLDYSTAEAAYQAHKAVFFADKHRIADAPDPETARAIGRSLKMDEEARKWWDVNCLQFMADVLCSKFTQNRDLGVRLLLTGKSRLIHVDEMDMWWGVTPDGVGHNFLGRLLQLVRHSLPNFQVGE